MKFKVGDRVRCVHHGDSVFFNPHLIGKTGTIMMIEDEMYSYDVLFDTPYDENDNCKWLCSEDMLELVEEEAEPEINKPEYSVPINKFLFIEDGSVDVDELAERLEATNPEILIVVYRQGSDRPQLINIEK